jgi:gluconolactonase
LPVGPAASRSARAIQPPSQRVLRPREIDHRGQRSIRQAQPIHAGPLGVDVDGNLWCGWGMGRADLDGVKVFNPEGKPIGFIALPERCANVCFGGRKRNRLFMAASHSLYALYVNAQGTLGN